MTIAYATLLLCCFPLVAQAQGLGSATSRFSWDNDFYFFRDAQISNVFSYQRHFSAQADPEDDLAWQRKSWSIQQTMQTPNKDTPMNQLSKDVPFVGTLVGQKSWYTFNNNDLQGYAISVGVVGDLSMADKTQALIHRWRGVEVYAGWSDQYPNELILNVHAMKKWKMMRGKHWDVAGGGNVALGNMVSHVGGELVVRIGSGLPLGFAYVPNSFGLNSHYLASISSEKETFYAAMVLQSYAIAHHMYLDGSLFQAGPKTYKTSWFGLAMLGLHYETISYGVHFTLQASTVNIDADKAPFAIGNERLGAFTYDWRY